MHVAYWIIAGLIAALYLYGGVLKWVRTPEQLRPMMPWVDDMPVTAVRAIGVIEIAGAIGLILPPLTGIAPWLALVAAIGFVALQIGALYVHLNRGDKLRQLGLNIVLLIGGAVTIWLATSWL